MAEKEKKISSNRILDGIVAKTFTRHADLSEEDFFKAIGITETDKSEEEIVRNGKFTLIREIAKGLIEANQRVQLITQTLALGLGLNEEDYKKTIKENK